jgi:RES domain
MAKAGSHFPPKGLLRATLVEWGSDQELHRIHPAIYRPDEFNSSRSGDARFSPLFDKSDAIVPNLYAGTTFDCALMETVFHDVPYAAGLKTLAKTSHVAGRVHSTIRFPRDLRLIDLRSIALRKLGIARKNLIDTDASGYSLTRQWALALYEQNKDAQGLLWTSRQNDDAQAIVLFEPRLAKTPFVVVSGPNSLLLSDGSACAEVLLLAERLGVLLI